LDQQNIDKIITNYLSKNIVFSEENLFATKLSLLDTLGCIYNASTYEDPMRFASRDVYGANTNPFKVLGDIKSSNEIARYFSILTRWFDYNDTFLAKEWAHPSDNIGTALGYFINHKEKNFSVFLQSIIQMYEIQGCLALGTSLNKHGYDHVFYVKLASGAVFSSLLSDQNYESISRTVNNILQDGLNLRSYRQAPNVGKRKSWAAGDAVSRGIELASISQFPDNIYENIQDDKIWGFNKVFLDDDILSFGKDPSDWVIQNILYKVLYPAEFHGQSAVEASFKLSDLFNDKEKDIDEIIIETHEPALRIISNKKELNNSSDRDHSLEYMVSAALIFKEITSDTYSDNFHGIDKVNELRKKIKVLENKDFTKNYYEISKRHISNEIYFKYKDGSLSKKEKVETPIGHPDRRDEAVPFLKKKFISNVFPYFGEKSEDLWENILQIDIQSEFVELLNILDND
tara:strand:- start:202 stop:1578 length:1377 start_codon:yes stop_codon:yes gene_type:complete